MADYREIVTGTIVDAQGKPVVGARVEVYDKDLLIDDHLGTDTTDGLGTFRVGFGWSDYKDAFFEDRPDIFLNVTPRGSEKATKTDVFSELRGRMADDDTEVLDLGEIKLA